ncbi:MAG: threonine transporter [Bacteroidetes bacterium]|nr:threonine transporter [Bacteroidota bacterium]
MNNNQTTIHPFNNIIETGLRILSILNASFPVSFDLQMLVYLDYLTVHSGDIVNGVKSLHPAVPSRKGEMFVRRSLIKESLDVFESKGLIVKKYQAYGIEYSVSENATPFIESLSEEYSLELNTKAHWVVNKFVDIDVLELEKYMQRYMTVDDNNVSVKLIING